MELSRIVENDCWLTHAVIRKPYNNCSLHEIKEMLARSDIHGFVVSEFDNEHFIINKVNNRRTSMVTSGEKQKLLTIFQNLEPLHKGIKTKRDVYLEIIGVPLHLYSHRNLRSIGENFGEVMEVSYIPTSFHKVAMKISMGIDKIIPQIISIFSSQDSFEVTIKEICKYRYKSTYETVKNEEECEEICGSPIHNHMENTIEAPIQCNIGEISKENTKKEEGRITPEPTFDATGPETRQAECQQQ